MSLVLCVYVRGNVVLITLAGGYPASFTLAAVPARTHCTLPRKVVVFISTPIQRDQDMGAAVTVGKRELGFTHLLSRCL